MVTWSTCILPSLPPCPFPSSPFPSHPLSFPSFSLLSISLFSLPLGWSSANGNNIHPCWPSRFAHGNVLWECSKDFSFLKQIMHLLVNSVQNLSVRVCLRGTEDRVDKFVVPCRAPSPCVELLTYSCIMCFRNREKSEYHLDKGSPDMLHKLVNWKTEYFTLFNCIKGSI